MLFEVGVADVKKTTVGDVMNKLMVPCAEHHINVYQLLQYRIV